MNNAGENPRSKPLPIIDDEDDFDIPFDLGVQDVMEAVYDLVSDLSARVSETAKSTWRRITRWETT